MYPEWLPLEWHWDHHNDPNALLLEHKDMTIESWFYLNALLHDNTLTNNQILKICEKVFTFKMDNLPEILREECTSIWFSLPTRKNIQKNILNLMIQYQPAYTIPWLELICSYALQDNITYDITYLSHMTKSITHKTDGDFIAFLYVLLNKNGSLETLTISNISMVGDVCLNYSEGIYPSLDYTSDDYVDFSPLVLQAIQYKASPRDKQYLKDLKKITRKYLKKKRAQ